MGAFCYWTTIDLARRFAHNKSMRAICCAGLCVLVLILACFSCDGVKEKPDRTLVIAHNLKASPINPLFTESTISASLLDIIYDPLVRYTANGELKPALAREWKISPDGLEWVFSLHDGIRFQDGSELTAHDVKATYEALMSKEGGFYSQGLANIDRIEAISDTVLKIKLKIYDSFFSFYLNAIHIVPAKFIKHGIDSLPAVGSGPFRLRSFSPEHIELDANKDYFLGCPFLDRVIVDIYPNQRTCLAKLVAGDADMVILTGMFDYDVFANIREFEARQFPMETQYWVLLNVRRPPLKNSAIRKLLLSVMGGVDAYSRKDNDHGSDFYGKRCLSSLNEVDDVKKAIELLNKEGWRDSDGDSFLDNDGQVFRVSFLIAADDEISKRVAKQIKDCLEQIGIGVEYEAVPSYKDLIAKGFIKRDYDLMLISSNVRSGMTSQYFFWHSSQIEKGGNSGGYSNPEVDKLLDEIRYNPDPLVRKKAEEDLAKALRDDPPGIPLFVKKTPVLVNKKFTGFSSDPFEFFSSFRNVKVKEGVKGGSSHVSH